ncbi:type II secretion system minor pseudopilin GspI [Alcanivorax sp.]|jgi:general secretion pathway protein I|uniref:type II secretion system minor pseudopilin GspI n=1 Tax=Alcanivorax sp. TaxID=1872427 RepID=UPI000C3EAFD4|nr:type II secretion system minor pseudopilin GspI [Alcanivorax sp.]MBQ25406.1 type II secretion system protein GspI [Alcanivorax sp.]|tara:strand:- start:1680 stop:2060 length:381 start_codon:yes stop_codon:yes gene_type:complete
MKRQQGFTLVEVLIAVSILALVMVVLGQTMGSTARAYTNINETHLGFLVASDKLVEMQVYQQWPSTGESDSTVTRNGREWWINTRVSEGPYPDTRRVDIEVGMMQDDDEGQMAYHLASLIGKPASG